jgi:hypothetical protein
MYFICAFFLADVYKSIRMAIDFTVHPEDKCYKKSILGFEGVLKL